MSDPTTIRTRRRRRPDAGRSYARRRAVPAPMPLTRAGAAGRGRTGAGAGGRARGAAGRAPGDRRRRRCGMERVVEELVAWLKTLASAAVYATLIVTFGFQVARVEGHSMAPTLADQDRLIVNKLAYRIGEPHIGDIVMLYYPLNPEKSFVKRVIAEEGDQVRIVDGKVYRNDVPLDDCVRAARVPQPRRLGPAGRSPKATTS